MNKSSRLWERFEDAAHDNGQQMTSISNDAITALEAAESHIDELREQLRTVELSNSVLESRTVTVKQPAHDRFFDYAEMALIYRDEQWQRTLAAAGIQVIEGEGQ